MGFYGNISSVNKSTFQFDKIYPNRKAMDENADLDGIFVGRYVLVDYDAEIDLSSIYREQLPDEYKEMPFVIAYQDKDYIGPNDNLFFSGLPSEPGDDSVEYIITMSFGENSGRIIGKPSFILVIGRFDSQTLEYEQLSKPVLYYTDINGTRQWPDNIDIDDDSFENYLRNYQIDNSEYGNIGRGWDSTVWQKTYKNDKVTYVMVAELNSVVPTFDLSVEAPTLPPRKPHWDSDTSSVYYKMHIQPNWSMQVKPSEGGPSDLTGDHYYFDENGEEQHVDDEPLSLYWNQDGFNKEIDAHDDEVNNAISITPTGYSGQEYYNHYTGETEPAEDTYEISVMLPQIGNTIADIWNIIYGEGDENNNNERNLALEWNIRTGERAYELDENTGNLTYNKDALNTLAGTINTVHDLMGMIIIEPNSNILNNATEIAKLDPNCIYYINGKYYRKAKKYIYVSTAAEARISGANLVDLYNGEYYVRRMIPVLDNGVQTIEYKYIRVQANDILYENESYWSKNGNNYTLIQNPFIPNKMWISTGFAEEYEQAATLDSSKTYYYCPGRYVTASTNSNFPVGIRYISNTTTSGVTVKYKKYEWSLNELPLLNDNFGTLFGLVLKLNDILSFGDRDTRDLDTVQGTLNNLKDVIRQYQSLSPNYVLTTNTYGQVGTRAFDNSSITFKYANMANTETWTTGSNIDYQYINPSVNNGRLKIDHTTRYAGVSDTTSTANKNTGTGTGFNANSNDTLLLHTPIIDDRGHVVAKNTETVTLPYNFKKIRVTKANNTTTLLEPQTTTEILKMQGDSTWIATDVLNPNQAGQKTITFNHLTKSGITVDSETEILDAVAPVTTVQEPIKDFYGNAVLDEQGNPQMRTVTGKEATIPQFKVDQAGHLTEVSVLDPSAAMVTSAGPSLLYEILGNDGYNITVDPRRRSLSQWAELIEDLKYVVSHWRQSISEATWPIGSVFFTVDSRNPNAILGIGTWERIGVGKAIIGADAGENAETTSGADTKTISTENLPSHNHTMAHTHGIDSHSHSLTPHFHRQATSSEPTDATEAARMETTSIKWPDGSGETFGSYLVKGDAYEGTAYTAWRTSYGYTGSVNSSSRFTSTGSKALTTNASSASSTGSTGSGTAFNVRQASISLHVWKRTG